MESRLFLNLTPDWNSSPKIAGGYHPLTREKSSDSLLATLRVRESPSQTPRVSGGKNAIATAGGDQIWVHSLSPVSASAPIRLLLTSRCSLEFIAYLFTVPCPAIYSPVELFRNRMKKPFLERDSVDIFVKFHPRWLLIGEITRRNPQSSRRWRPRLAKKQPVKHQQCLRELLRRRFALAHCNLVQLLYLECAL